MQKAKPILSVILPCYNAEAFLQYSIPSILNQSFTNFELLIIDDGSIDDSYKICNCYAEEDNRIKLYRNERNLGVVRTLNRGIDLSNGAYIARMDADDISDLQRFEKQLNYLETNKVVSVIGTRAQAIDLDGKKLNSKSNIYLEKETIQFSALFTQPLFHGSVFGKAAVFKENKYGKDSKAEDFELWLRMISKGIEIENLDETLYYYRINPNSVSQQNERQQKLDHNLISAEYLEKNYKIRLDQKIVDLMNNRPLGVFEKKDVVLALDNFKLIYKRQKSIIAELRKYYQRQRVDIVTQAIKKCSDRSLYFQLIILLMKESLNRTAIKHIANKLNK